MYKKFFFLLFQIETFCAVQFFFMLKRYRAYSTRFEFFFSVEEALISPCRITATLCRGTHSRASRSIQHKKKAPPPLSFTAHLCARVYERERRLKLLVPFHACARYAGKGCRVVDHLRGCLRMNNRVLAVNYEHFFLFYDKNQVFKFF